MIHQFDVFSTPLRGDKRERPFVLVVQSHLFDNQSRICAPLVAEKFIRPDGRVNPGFEIEGLRCYLHPLELITLPVRALRKPILNLESERYYIIAALDLVFTGI